MPRKQIKRPETAVRLERVQKQLYKAMRTLQPAILDSAASEDVAHWTADLIRLQKEIGRRLTLG